MKKFAGLITVALITVFWTLISLTGVFSKFENRLYDLFLGLKKAPQEAPELLLVEIDNFALDEIGPWPWKRDIYGNALLRMKELGASQAVFDIEFLSPSNFPELDEYFAQSLQFFGNSYLTINTSELEIPYTEDELNYVRNRFLFNFEGNKDIIEEGNHKSHYEAKFNTLRGYDKYDWSGEDAKNILAEGMSPAMNQFISRAKGAGFTNVIVDADGVRRRIELLSFDSTSGKITAQLILAPLLSKIQPEKIIRTKNKIILQNATINGKTKTLEIPLDEYGRMVINWTHNTYGKAYRHESVMFLHQMDKAEDNIYLLLKEILSTLEDIDSAVYNSVDDFFEVPYNLYSAYTDILDYKNFILSACTGYDINSYPVDGGIDEATYEEYFALRENYFKDVAEFIITGYDDKLQEKLFELRDSLGEEKYEEFSTAFGELFDILKNESEMYNSLFNEKKNIYKDAFCIIGHTASSSTDLGTTPFERSYPNVGTHANVYNTIIQQDFVKQINWIWGIIISFILLIITVELTKKKRVLIQNLAGVAAILIVVAIPSIAMRLGGLYIPSFTAILISFTGYLAVTIMRFILADKDKKFLQATFGAYVAPAVVAEIVKHPELASLGGKSENLTALFSDVMTFSGFTEVINNEAGEEKGAERLVEILNDYLGVLSDAIMDCNGTIDKYVGDEIVSFFGAPIPAKNNAYDACVAGIRMLQAEKKFNEENKDRLPINPKTGEPFYLHSRVGLNTGNMVVGNMGTEKKLNYTIMGNNVNLASRLEGTNKVYGSWIMCSESTWLKANEGEYEGKLVARKFDCVRVINVKKPVGIYNILGLKDEMCEEQIKAAEIFNQGIEIYLKGTDTPEVKKDVKELKEAFNLFKQADEMYPEDLSSKVFMKRCADYIKDGVPEIWDGVYTMTSK